MRTYLRRFNVVVFVLVVGLSLVVSACNKGGSSPVSPTPAPTGGQTGLPQATFTYDMSSGDCTADLTKCKKDITLVTNDPVVQVVQNGVVLPTYVVDSHDSVQTFVGCYNNPRADDRMFMFGVIPPVIIAGQSINPWVPEPSYPTQVCFPFAFSMSIVLNGVKYYHNTNSAFVSAAESTTAGSLFFNTKSQIGVRVRGTQ